MIKNGIARILISVGDLNESVEFYRDILQMSVVEESDVAKPPNLGLLAIAFATDNLAALIEKLQNHNIKFLSEPVEISISQSERVRAIVVEAPNGVNVQFFGSRIDTDYRIF